MKIENGILVEIDCEEKNLVFPKEMRAIDDEVETGDFLNLTDVESITVEEYNSFYHSDGNCLLDTAENRLIIGCKNSVIPEETATIEFNAFCDRPIKQINLPEGLLVIGGHAFSGTEIQSVFIPPSVNMIYPGAFAHCRQLRTLEVHPDNPVYRSENNCIIERKTNTLVACCDDPGIPDGVEIVGESALMLANTRYITLPGSVREIQKIGIGLPPFFEFGAHEETSEDGENRVVQAIIRAPKGSDAIRFAKENNLPYVEISASV